MRAALAIDATGLQREERLVMVKSPGEVAKIKNIASGAMNAKQRRPIATARDFDQ
jgi:hypothetical protein